MGRKVLQTSVAISLLSSALTLFCLTQQMHSTTFAFGLPVVRMDFTLTTVSFSVCGAGMAPGFVMHQITNMCHKTPKESDLHTFSQATCTGAMRTIFPSICEATQQAYLCGMTLIIACVTNAILQMVGSFMAYKYIEGSVKKQYRQMWAILVGIGTFIQFAGFFAYVMWATRSLHELRARPGFPLTVGKGWGMKWALILILVSVMLQFIALVLTHFAKVGYESLMEERRDQQKFMEECKLYEETLNSANSIQGGGAYDGSNAAFAPQPGYGGYGAAYAPQPAPQPAMGMQQPGMQAAW